MRIKQGDHVRVDPRFATGKGLARVVRLENDVAAVKYDDSTTQRVYITHLSMDPELLRKGMAKKAEEAQKIGRNIRR